MDLPEGSDFRLGGLLVEPDLNRLTRGGESVRLEPKMMDLLVLLARRAGEVVSKDDIVAGVWEESFVTDSVITRAVAGLRHALGDDARSPSFIETISKRGYRLIAEIEAPGGKVAPAPRPGLRANFPYVVGQWVCGETFYGRGAQLLEVLDGNRDAVWLLGTRRLGKTSLLKHLEHLTAGDPERGDFPLFWDLQGAAEPAELHLDFREALLDAEERLEAVGIRVGEVEDEDLFASLGRLRRRLRSQGLRLLLLCDEVEELLHLDREDPSLLGKLRRATQSQEGIRTVLASSVRLWALAEAARDTSPFLHGFVPPLYLGTMDDEAARELVRQTRLPPERRPSFDDATVEEIRARCGNHPFLLQLLSKRCLETGDLAAASAEVEADEMVRHFFAVDFELLGGGEQRILRALAQEQGNPEGAEPLAESLQRLERLGFVVRAADGTFSVANRFFRLWLRE